MVCLFVCLFSCVGCGFVEDIIGEDDDDDENKYVWEYGLIYTSQRESIPDRYTFEELKSIRDRLKLKTNSRKYHSPSNTSETLFRNYLQDTTNMTASKIEYVISYLNENKNIILYFYCKDNSSETVWYYLEKR